MIAPELEDAGLINQGLFTVQGENADHYFDALDQIHQRDLRQETEILEFRIDAYGRSPELADELGEDYLQVNPANRFGIIISPEQRDAPLIAVETSYDEQLLRQLYKVDRELVSYICAREALVVGFYNGVSFFERVDDILLVEEVRLYLQSTRQTLEKLEALRGMASLLGESDHLYQKDYIDEMLALVGAVGNPRERPEIREVSCPVQCLFNEFFGGTYLFKQMRGAGQNFETLLITTEPVEFESKHEMLHFRHVSDKSVINYLHDAGVVGYDLSRLPKRLDEMRDFALLDAGVDIVDASDVDRDKWLDQHKDQLPDVYWELREIHKGMLAGESEGKTYSEVRDASDDVRIVLALPAKEHRIVAHLLAELDEPDVFRDYWDNRSHFIKIFRDFNEPKKRYVIHKLKEAVEHKRDYVE